MALPNDVGQSRSEPWTYRTRLVPLRTYSGRVVHRRNKHLFTMEDAARIMAKLEPPAGSDGADWATSLIETLRMASIAMLRRILFFLPPGWIAGIYNWILDLVDMVMSLLKYDEKLRRDRAVEIIMYAAAKGGVSVFIEKPESF